MTALAFMNLIRRRQLSSDNSFPTIIGHLKLRRFIMMKIQNLTFVQFNFWQHSAQLQNQI